MMGGMRLVDLTRVYWCDGRDAFSRSDKSMLVRWAECV